MDRYAVARLLYTAASSAPGGTDPHAREREVLELAEHIVRIGSEFTRRRAGPGPRRRGP